MTPMHWLRPTWLVMCVSVAAVSTARASITDYQSHSPNGLPAISVVTSRHSTQAPGCPRAIVPGTSVPNLLISEPSTAVKSADGVGNTRVGQLGVTKRDAGGRHRRCIFLGGRGVRWHAGGSVRGLLEP